MPWSVAMTKSSSENLAKHHLERQGFITYLPRYMSRVGKEIKVKVLFPRYIFVFIEMQWHCIHGTRGVTRLLMRESTPAVVPDRIINDLKTKESNGLILLPAPPKFQLGEKVRVANGSLSGYFGIYDGMRSSERARILIELLGQVVPVVLDENDLAAVAVNGKG